MQALELHLKFLQLVMYISTILPHGSKWRMPSWGNLIILSLSLKLINTKRAELENCLSLTCSIIFFLSTILEPFGPNISQQIRKNFSVEESSFGYYENFSPFDMNDFKLKKPNILVKKYTRTEISDLMKKFESFKASK